MTSQEILNELLKESRRQTELMESILMKVDQQLVHNGNNEILAAKTEKEKTEMCNEKRNIYDILKTIGVPANLIGYQYIVFALELCLDNPVMIHSVIKKLYPTVAEKFNTTSSRVQRGIKHAIEIAWSRGNLEFINSIFGYTVNFEKGKPTNSEFVAMLVAYCKH